MQNQDTHGKMLTVMAGYLVCPVCHRNRRLAKIRSDTEGINIPVFCRDCKHEIIIDISRGQCFESRSR